MKVYINKKEYEVIPAPEPHILVPTKKELHGWWPGKRECTAERMLINPYNGCGIGCFFCYTLAFPGYFQLFREKGIITVAKDFDRKIARQLDSIDVAFCGYLSPVTEPFQPLEKKYQLSEKIIRVFVERNIPVEFITKSKIPPQVIETMKAQRHSFGQVSILTPPYITDHPGKLEELIEKAKSSGCTHIVASVLDIPQKISTQIFDQIDKKFGTGIKRDYQRLYKENIDGYLNAGINYRKRLFDRLRNICERKNLSFALCMEYEIVDGKPRGLNREFMSSINCEGIDIPVYIRKNGKFYPGTNCKGNCLNCSDPKCGISDLALRGKETYPGWKLKDYRRWSRELKR